MCAGSSYFTMLARPCGITTTCWWLSRTRAEWILLRVFRWWLDRVALADCARHERIPWLMRCPQHLTWARCHISRHLHHILDDSVSEWEEGVNKCGVDLFHRRCVGLIAKPRVRLTLKNTKHKKSYYIRSTRQTPMHATCVRRIRSSGGNSMNHVILPRPFSERWRRNANERSNTCPALQCPFFSPHPSRCCSTQRTRATETHRNPQQLCQSRKRAALERSRRESCPKPCHSGVSFWHQKPPTRWERPGLWRSVQKCVG